MKEFAVGGMLYTVREEFGRPQLCSARITKVTPQQVWIDHPNGGASGFGWRTRLDRLNAERYATSADDAKAAYVQKCADYLEGAESAFKAALKFSEESK